MPARPLNVLFLCSGNSARSIMAESILNAVGAGRFRAYSAGSHATGVVSRFARELLQSNRLPAEGLRSKSWEEFAAPGAPVFDFVITVCDQTARETCPVWPGAPMTAHWGIRDPAAAQGDIEMKQRAFFRAFSELQHRLRIFVSLPVERLDKGALQTRLDAIGSAEAAPHENRLQARTN
jgi:arsenate reductase (thioredoxin)